MRYYGLDYGTTRSLLFNYDDSDGSIGKTADMLSAVRVLKGKIVKKGKDAWNEEVGSFEESPKYSIREGSLDNMYNGVTYKRMISEVIGNMLSDDSGNLKNSQITITVPNLYTSQNYVEMYNIVADCLKQIVGENNGVRIHLIPEPVSAALYYAHTHLQDDGTVYLVVCDIGGGTTDMCIVKCDRHGGELIFNVLEGLQQAKIGGNDFDKRIIEFFGRNEKLMNIAEKNAVKGLKSMLSVKDEYTNIIGHMSRNQFEGAICRELTKLRELMKNLREESKKGDQVDSSWHLMPIGGSCHIPAIRRLLKNTFPEAQMDPLTEDVIISSVAQGAAIYSAYNAKALRQYDSITVGNAMPHSVEYQLPDRNWHVIVPQNSPDGVYRKSVMMLLEPRVEGDYYYLGIINIRESDRVTTLNAKDDVKFELRDRAIKDIRLQLEVEITGNHINTFKVIDECGNQMVQLI